MLLQKSGKNRIVEEKFSDWIFLDKLLAVILIDEELYPIYALHVSERGNVLKIIIQSSTFKTDIRLDGHLSKADTFTCPGRA